MKIAIIHDWINGWRGGEKCLEMFLDLYPNADVYTLFYQPEKINHRLKNFHIISSVLNKIKLFQNKYRYLLPLYPWAIQKFKLDQYDLILSSSHCVAKSILKPKKSIHICYCYTPMRYLWGFHDEYFGKYSKISRIMIKCVFLYLKRFDLKTNENVNQFIAISNYIQKRIENIYHKQSEVIYPPVDTVYFNLNLSEKSDYYLVVSALVPYKKIDMVVDTFNKNKKKLIIVGSGPEYENLRNISYSNIKYLGWVDDERLRSLYQKAKGLIFPTIEDFGIVPLEAQACGTPVIAYAEGGALETVIHMKTGLFFENQDEICLNQAIDKFEKIEWDYNSCRENALKYSKDKFKKNIHNIIQNKYKEFNELD